MYRNVILDFLATKRKLIQETAYLQMTLCQIGTKYHNKLTQLIEKEDLVRIYHISEPRIYEKTYSFEHLANTIVMMVMELKQEVCFEIDALNFSLNDPFYLKDLRNINFKSLQATPIMEQGEVCGVVITYFGEPNQKITFTNNELLKLLANLNIDKETTICRELEKKITGYDDYYLIAMNKSHIYLNDLTKKELHISSNILDRKETMYIGRIKTFISQIGVKKIDFLGLDVYYLNQKLTISSSSDKRILSMYNLNNEKLPSEFSLLLVRFSPETSIDESLKKMKDAFNRLEIVDYDIYQYNDETFIYNIHPIMLKDVFNQIQSNYTEFYFVLVTSPNDINKQMNLIKICDYLYNNQPSEFVYKEYVKWLNNNNEIKLNYALKYNNTTYKYEVINSSNQEQICRLINLPLKVINRDAHFKAYNEICEYALKECAKFENQMIMLNLSTSLMVRRRNLEIVKKIISNNNTLWINVLDDKVLNSEEFTKLISKYKCLNLHLACDSSVFLSIKLMPCLMLFDAIYIQNEEYESIRCNEVGMPQAIMSYAINEQMLVIIENFKPCIDLDYRHASCYFVKEISKAN